MNIYVGNLNDRTSETQLRDLFSPFGEIKSLKIIMDAYTHLSRGFAFIEMVEKSAGEAAIEKLNNTSLDQQFIKVNEARNRNNYSRPENTMDRNLRERY